MSETALRRLLEQAGLSFQRTRSWKWSPDPDFTAKAERVLSLYRSPPSDGPVVCFDEMGPIQLIPHHGTGWAEVGRPERLRATYKRRHGVRYFFGALDVHADHLFGRLRERKSALDVLGFLKTVRMRYPPRQRIYLVMDNLSTHWTADIRTWAHESNVEFVPTPDLRELPQPDRVELRRRLGLRGQERRLPRLAHPPESPRRLHPPAQRLAAHRAHRSHRTPHAGGLTDGVSGATFTRGPLAGRARSLRGGSRRPRAHLRSARSPRPCWRA